MKNIAILASGSGTNAQKIMEYFRQSPKGKIVLLASNKKEAYALERAKMFDVPTVVFSKADLKNGGLAETLRHHQVDLLVLAGFLLQIPPALIQQFPDKIVNIHPALLPNYGGRGMYGMNVHQAVKQAGDRETGITIHLVNENYDEGKIVFQAAVPIAEADSPEQIAEKVHELEHKYYPNVIESLI
ncbi:formyltetrahydrofolate-dependent phosphoribosylglycinamide formyltransferase [Cyclobacterium xiamenense]|uniref:Phosphoribosylglycinamide formyltransferase n=1 Tax=Cyclobacterium xiamenense TaxID=1297121 RepID=A0A1H6WUC4_9BACT|nr:phosphoribosylglycinamide formyltransferase [Cyclobacterium xiamenense]SEJ20388.1 formyltetrahydrofolate-dependent phosphoribosylglycinamide formyltransferase [Cyclobacterium xiamenense]